MTSSGRTLNEKTLDQLIDAKSSLSVLRKACEDAHGLDTKLDRAIGSLVGELNLLNTDVNYFIINYGKQDTNESDS